jgi:starch synthase
VPTLFAIHNMAFQGTFPLEAGERLGLDPRHLTTDGLEYHGKLSFLKAGIRFADRLVTVSPTYAKEITTPEFGFGLEGLLAARTGELEGILNGVDYETWDPAHDPLIPACYSADDLSGKRACKAALQAELGLAVNPGVPILAFASRLTEQKMADVVLAAAPTIAENYGQLAFVAEGEGRFERGFAELAQRWPARIAGTIGYNETSAHRLLAGADILLAPARFEPCGLIQLYAMRYGTIPIVSPTGGLVDTVVDVDAVPIGARGGNGFSCPWRRCGRPSARNPAGRGAVA